MASSNSNPTARKQDPGTAFQERPPGDFRSLFQHFRKILELNNKVLEKIAEAERILGGNYLFDSAYLKAFVAEVSELTRQVIYHLNSLADNRYLMLYERFEAIRNNLEDLVSGGLGPYGEKLALAYPYINRDLDHLVGAKNANLAELSNNFDIRVPDGFAVTVTAYRLFMEENDLFAKVRELSGYRKDPAEYSARLEGLFAAAKVPPPIEEAVKKELSALFERLRGERPLAVRSSAVGEDAARSFAGQFRSMLNVPARMVMDAYKKVLASRFSIRALEYIGPEVDEHGVPVAVGIQEMISARTSGVMYSCNPARGANEMMISAVEGLAEPLVSGRKEEDRYAVGRVHPFSVISSRIAPKPLARPLADGLMPWEYINGGMRRGSSTLTRSLIESLAETAMLLEKAFGSPRDIEWAVDQDGTVILQDRPLRMEEAPSAELSRWSEATRGLPVLVEGLGHTVQAGVASGRVVHVTPDDDPARFPVGAIAVCRYASPKLSLILRKAGAIITDVGSPTGHLATIAREYRTPAIFGTGRATAILQEGIEVTVDAHEKRIYKGMLRELLAVQVKEDLEYLDAPELKTLRRTLRWVAPINLVDPDDPGFVPERCQTIHDIVHFCHEKAVDALVHHHSLGKGIKGMKSRPLATAIPIRIQVIDIGGGLEPLSGDTEVRIPDVRSRPFKALLKGLLREDVWDQEAAPFGLRDLLSSMTRPVSIITNPPEYSGENLAIIARDYCNLSLRLGYHFNVIDAYIAARPDDNYIYFRFVGGFAEKAKRLRRARLISLILEGLYFKVDIHGDLVVAKVKMLDRPRMEAILLHLGELIAFTRQLDVRMADEDSVERFFTKFLERAVQTIN